METLSNWQLPAALIIVLAIFMAMVAFAMTIVQRQKFSHYERDHNRAVLSAMRESYESQIALLTKQLTATEDRWKDVNHLLITAQNRRSNDLVERAQSPNRFTQSFSLRAPDYVIDDKLILVLTPFSEEERYVFDIIREACNQVGFRCIRGDEEYTPADILNHVIRLIMKARIVVANITTRNPNVLYELGIAHALGKQTILVSRTLDDMPFDVANMRILLWKDPGELERQIQQTILRTIADTNVRTDSRA